jgi:hypothetical protein
MMIWKKFNDQIALLLIILVFLLWGLEPFVKNYYGYGFSESVMGATVVIATLVSQYYFRRKEPNENGGEPPK